MRTLFLILFSLLISFVFASPSHADCYTVNEAAAEQALRLHSELLVIGLNCRHIAGEGEGEVSRINARHDSYEKYRLFTKRHTQLLKRYEDIIEGYYVRIGSDDPVQDIHELRTNMANELAELVVKIRPDVFCHRYKQRLDKANTMTHEDVKRWATTYFPSSPPSRYFCPKTSY